MVLQELGMQRSFGRMNAVSRQIDNTQPNTDERMRHHTPHATRYTLHATLYTLHAIRSNTLHATRNTQHAVTRNAQHR